MGMLVALATLLHSAVRVSGKLLQAKPSREIFPVGISL
jgi:hypothetical protein